MFKIYVIDWEDQMLLATILGESVEECQSKAEQEFPKNDTLMFWAYEHVEPLSYPAEKKIKPSMIIHRKKESEDLSRMIVVRGKTSQSKIHKAFEAAGTLKKALLDLEEVTWRRVYGLVSEKIGKLGKREASSLVLLIQQIELELLRADEE